MRRFVSTFLLGALAAMTLFLLGAQTLQAQAADSEKVNALFTEMKQHAALAEADAENLESYTRSSMAWETHAKRITSMKDHVNALIKDYNEVKDMRGEASPWQQEAIDRVAPLLKDMADHLTASIEHLNQNQTKVHMKPWQDYARANYEYAVHTAGLIRDFVHYGEAKNTVDKLEQKLELPETPATPGN